MWQKVLSDKRYMGLAVLLVVIAAIPLTLGLTQKQQDIRQHAAGSTCSTNNPIDAMLLIDKSGSMGPPVSSDDRIDPAKAAAENFVNILYQNGIGQATTRQNQTGVVSYAQLLTSTQGRTTLDEPLTLLSAQTAADTVNSKIQAITVYGRTCTQCAVYLANQEILAHGRPGVKKVVILLTDGGANAYGNVLNASKSAAEAAANTEVDNGHAQSGTIFFTIGIGTDVNTSFLQNIAQRTGGQYYFAPTAADLNSIYQQISTIVGKGTVSGNVFNDANKNLAHDSTETGLAGWKVDLIDPNSQSTIATTTTDAQGNYSFAGICDGAYQIKVETQAGWNQTTPPNEEDQQASISQGNMVGGRDFGFSLAPKSTSLVCSPQTLQLSTNYQAVTAILKDSSGNPVPNEPITYSANPTSSFLTTDVQTANTDQNGQAQFQIKVTSTAQPYSGNITLIHASTTNYTQSTCQVNMSFTPQTTLLNFTVFLHGIGNAGDNANPTSSSLSNKNPQHITRKIEVKIFDINNNQVSDTTMDADYSQTVGGWPISRDLGANFATGKYTVIVSSPGFLAKRYSNIISITSQQINTLPNIQLINGDVNSDNVLNILDYDLVVGCYSDFAPPIACNQTDQGGTDINDDGKNDQVDYNLFLRELSVQYGDAIDQSTNP